MYSLFLTSVLDVCSCWAFFSCFLVLLELIFDHG